MENEEKILEDTQVSRDVPIEYKQLLTIDEAAKIFNIGINKIREISNEPGCDFVLYVGSKRLIKKDKFKSFLYEQFVI